MQIIKMSERHIYTRRTYYRLSDSTLYTETKVLYDIL